MVCSSRHFQTEVGATDMNATSSRSHSIFAMYLHGVNRELGAANCSGQIYLGIIKISKCICYFMLFLQEAHYVKPKELQGALHLVDLAGSERLDKQGTWAFQAIQICTL